MDGSPRGGAGWVHVVLPAILAPLEGCVCVPGLVAGLGAPVLAQAWCLSQGCSPELLVLCLQTPWRVKLVRFSVAGDGGEESKGEKEERQGVG